MTKTNWDNNHLQFARLLDEIAAAGLTKKQYTFLEESADMTRDMVDEVLDRARIEFSRAKYGHNSVRRYTPAKDIREFTNQ